MLNNLKRDKKRRQLFKHSEFFRVFTHCVITLKKRFLFSNKPLFKRLFFYTRIKNLCWVTGRQRAVYRAFRVSRVVLKGVSVVGLLPGLRKISW